MESSQMERTLPVVRGSLRRRPVKFTKLVYKRLPWEIMCGIRKNFNNEIDGLDYVCRPANLPATNPGRDHLIIDFSGKKVGVFTVLGSTFMGPKVDCPFATSDRIVTELNASCDIILCEIHAETTSEKESMGWHLDGRVAMIYGTHTHVPTADGRILRGGSAYQSDLGMTGPRESVLGRDINACLGRFKDGMPRKCPVAEGDVGMQGCIVEINPDTGLADSHQLINWRNQIFQTRGNNILIVVLHKGDHIGHILSSHP